MTSVHKMTKAQLIAKNHELEGKLQHFRENHGCMQDPWCVHCAVLEGYEPVEDRRPPLPEIFTDLEAPRWVA